MYGTEMKLKDFLNEYHSENVDDETVEIIDPKTEEVAELTGKEFKEFLEQNEKGVN